MREVIINCANPSCGKKLRIRLDLGRGVNVKCKLCGRTFQWIDERPAKEPDYTNSIIKTCPKCRMRLRFRKGRIGQVKCPICLHVYIIVKNSKLVQIRQEPRWLRRKLDNSTWIKSYGEKYIDVLFSELFMALEIILKEVQFYLPSSTEANLRSVVDELCNYGFFTDSEKKELQTIITDRNHVFHGNELDNARLSRDIQTIEQVIERYRLRFFTS